ncbi:MAG: hypothetical protein FD180_1245 [Planctomycetota bacterium]|nr:MAG: hypothetical protein FD180_1245 [Planctomycetota bacterium]
MKWLPIAVLLLSFAGCTIGVEPGLREPYTTRATWKGTRLKVEALDGTAMATSKPGALTYEFDPKEWNPFLAKTLAEDLKELESSEGEPAVLKVGISRVNLEERAASQGSYAEFWIKVSGPLGEKEYRGLNESQLNFRDAARRAAADAMKALVEDAELRRGFTVNPK